MQVDSGLNVAPLCCSYLNSTSILSNLNIRMTIHYILWCTSDELFFLGILNNYFMNAYPLLADLHYKAINIQHVNQFCFLLRVTVTGRKYTTIHISLPENLEPFSNDLGIS